MMLQKRARTSVKESDYQLRLHSYKAFITLYLFSVCTTTRVTEYIMLRIEEHGETLSWK